MLLLLLSAAAATSAESPFCCGCCWFLLSGILICTLKSAQILCSLAPLGPMTVLWYCWSISTSIVTWQSRSCTISEIRFLAASTQFLAPFKVTLSLDTPDLGKETMTPPNSSPMCRNTSPLLATKYRWCFGSTVIFSSTTLSNPLILFSSSTLAAATASLVPTMVITSRSLSFSPGKMILAPVLSLMACTLLPWRPIRNLWCSGFALTSHVMEDSCFSLASSASIFLAFSTSSLGPRTVTLSDLDSGGGNLMETPPQSSMTDWMSFPPEPIIVLWILAGMVTSAVTTLAISSCIFWILLTALSTFSFFPVTVIMSDSEPLSGSSIFVSVSERICLMEAPLFPMMNLWNCLKMGTFT